MKGGLSGATLQSLTVGGIGYVLRRADATYGGDRASREIVCMKIASERGVAPKLRHVDDVACISIMQRIDAAPAGRPRGSQYVERVAGTLRHLHEGPAFPKGTSAPALVRQVDESLRARGPEGLPAPLVRTMAELARVTHRFAETAPCHNDLNPGNVLATEAAVYFVDWETACASDPFFDLAELGVFAFPTPDGRAELLEAYLARRPTEEERARATLARVAALGFYGAMFVHLTVLGGGPVRPVAAALRIPELLATMAASRERFAPDVVAASLLEEMRRETETAAFEAAARSLAP